MDEMTVAEAFLDRLRRGDFEALRDLLAEAIEMRALLPGAALFAMQHGLLDTLEGFPETLER